MESFNSFGLEARGRRQSNQRILEINAQNALKTAKVYVDPIQRWPTKIRCFMAGSCHMFIELPRGDELPDFGALHSVARALGLKREWFQDKADMPHYDLTVSKREMAVKLGVTEVERVFVAQEVFRWKAFQIGCEVVQRVTGVDMSLE